MLSFGLALFSLVAGGFLGHWIRTVQSRLDHQLARFEDLVNEVGALEALVQDYWVLELTTASAPEVYEKLVAEILGRFSLITEIFVGVSELLPENVVRNLQVTITEFYENATGGNFGDSIRAKDMRRVQAGYRIGGILTRELRDTAAERMISPPERFVSWIKKRFVPWIQTFFGVGLPTPSTHD